MYLRYPVKFIGITQDFTSSHMAIDLGWNNNYGGKNALIYACGNGVVSSIVDGRANSMIKGDSGNYVTIEYDNGYISRVCHLLKNSIVVKVGDRVTKKSILGKMGNSGYCGKAKANHCHLILWKDGKRVNPRLYLYVYPEDVVAKSNTYKLLYYNGDVPQFYDGIIPKLKYGVFGWKRGDKNKNVGYIQQFLNWYLGSNLMVDNSFGPATQKEVLKYQNQEELRMDGKFGPACIRRMKMVKKALSGN